MRFARSCVLALFLVFAGTPVLAQTLEVTGLGDQVVYGNVYVGHYNGYMPGWPALDIFCVDFQHRAYLNVPWTVTVRNLGEGANLDGTRHGADALAGYRTAAWLAGQFGTTPVGADNAGWGSLHAAIWHLFTPGDPDWTYPLDYITGGGNLPFDWIYDAQQAVAPMNASAFNNWYVITDNNPDNGDRQEFITRFNVVPEPATLILMGTGLIAVAGMTVVMRQSVG